MKLVGRIPLLLADLIKILKDETASFFETIRSLYNLISFLVPVTVIFALNTISRSHINFSYFWRGDSGCLLLPAVSFTGAGEIACALYLTSFL